MIADGNKYDLGHMSDKHELRKEETLIPFFNYQEVFASLILY
jgi:hypothetical protein